MRRDSVSHLFPADRVRSSGGECAAEPGQELGRARRQRDIEAPADAPDMLDHMRAAEADLTIEAFRREPS